MFTKKNKTFEHRTILMIINYYNIILTGVDVGVFLHIGLLMESFSTKLARVWSRVRVDQQVRG